MPTLPGHLCYHPGCFNKTREAYCAKHQRVRVDTRREYDRQRELNDPFRKLYGCVRWTEGTRMTVLHRDPLCCECGHRASTDADHHPMGAREIVAKFGVNEFYNPARCRGLCHSCHAKKSSTEKS
jgi:5-methylcytosine-specific restriction enzyme A